jgi:hypothetical protein
VLWSSRKRLFLRIRGWAMSVGWFSGMKGALASGFSPVLRYCLLIAGCPEMKRDKGGS